MITRKRYNEERKYEARYCRACRANESVNEDTQNLLESNLKEMNDLQKGNIICQYYSGRGDFSSNLIKLKEILAMMAHPDLVEPYEIRSVLKSTGCSNVKELVNNLLDAVLEYKKTNVDVAIYTLRSILRDLD